MKKLIYILMITFLFADNYKLFKIEKMINEMKQKEVKFLPIGFYNVFPINIDRSMDIKQYIKKQNITIDLKAISANRVFINGKWYKKGDKIQNLIIDKITNNCVYFVSKVINNAQFSVCISPNIIKVSK